MCLSPAARRLVSSCYNFELMHRFIMNSTHFDHVPMLLETPQSEGGYAREIELLYSLVEDA